MTLPRKIKVKTRIEPKPLGMGMAMEEAKALSSAATPIEGQRAIAPTSRIQYTVPGKS